MGNIAAEARNLLDHAGAEEHVLDAGRQEQRFKLRVQLLIGERHLKFIFKVADPSQWQPHAFRLRNPPKDRARSLPLHFPYRP